MNRVTSVRIAVVLLLGVSGGGPILAAVPVKLNGTLPTEGDVDSGFQFSPDGSRVLYVADQDTDQVSELYSVASAGGASVKLNGPFAVGGDVSRWEISSDGNRVLYLADQMADGVDEVFSVPSGGGAAARLNGVLAIDRDVASARFSSGGTRAVYCADQVSDEVLEIFGVAGSGGQWVKLSGAMVAGGDVVGDENAVRVSPNGSRVVYEADQQTDETLEIFSVLNTGGTVTKLNGSLVAGGDVTTAGSGVQFSPDGSRVLYRADQQTDEVFEIYSVPSAGGTAVKLNGPLAGGGDVSVSGLQFSPNGGRVLYLADQNTDAVDEVFSVPSGGGTAVRLNGPLVAGGDVLAAGLQFSPDSSRVLYLADQNSDAVNEVFIVSSTGGTPLRLNGPLVANGDVLADGLQFSPDSSRVLYRADQDANDVFEVYSVAATGGTPVRLNELLVAGGDVESAGFTLDGSQIVYLADQDTNDVFELYRVSSTGGVPVKLNGPLIEGGDVTHWQISPDGRRVVYRADQEVDEMLELFAVDLVGGIPGDFSGNGVVDAADYTVWRNGLGTIFTLADYGVWKSHFGQSFGNGAAGTVPSQFAVPEPATWLLLGIVSGAIAEMSRRVRRR